MKNLRSSPENGNVFLYILIAVVLFATLAIVLNRGQDGGEKTVLTSADLKTRTQRLLTYAGQISSAWLRMSDTGTDLTELDLTLPSSGSFNTAPTIHKLFHPDGGGLTHRTMDDVIFRGTSPLAFDGATTAGWRWVKVNADWSPTSGTDFIAAYLGLKRDLCQAINQDVTGSDTITTVTVNFANTFVAGSAALTEAACPACRTYGTVCVQNGDGDNALVVMIEMR